MFSHVMLGADDIAAVEAVLRRHLAALGGPGGTIDEGRLVYMHNGGRFVIRTPLNGEPATGANGATLGFRRLARGGRRVARRRTRGRRHRRSRTRRACATPPAAGCSISPTCAIRRATSCADSTAYRDRSRLIAGP